MWRHHDNKSFRPSLFVIFFLLAEQFPCFDQLSESSQAPLWTSLISNREQMFNSHTSSLSVFGWPPKALIISKRFQSQGSRGRNGKRNESWLSLSIVKQSLVITLIKSRWLRPQLASFQCSMIGLSLGCYPLTVSTYPGDDDDEDDEDEDDEDEDDETFRPWHQSWSIMLKYLKLSVVQKGKLDLWQEFVEQPVAAMVSQTGLINTQISVKTQTHMQTQLCLKIATVCRWWQSLLVI